MAELPASLDGPHLEGTAHALERLLQLVAVGVICPAAALQGSPVHAAVALARWTSHDELHLSWQWQAGNVLRPHVGSSCASVLTRGAVCRQARLLHGSLQANQHHQCNCRPPHPTMALPCDQGWGHFFHMPPMGDISTTPTI
jgi:hypothetical protein